MLFRSRDVQVGEQGAGEGERPWVVRRNEKDGQRFGQQTWARPDFGSR